MEKLVSIIVPTFNVEKYLSRCIDSLLKQTYKNIEIIVVDDGSTDKSGEIGDSYVKLYENIFIIHKQNGGLGSARNCGIEHARGSYLTFVDGDDYLNKDHLSNMIRMINQTEADTCIAGYTKVYGQERLVAHPYQFAKQVYSDEEIKNEILVYMCGKSFKSEYYLEMSVCMTVFTTDIIKKNGLHFKSERDFISEDLIFDTDYYPLAHKVCICNDDAGYMYCDNEGSLTTKYRANRFELQQIMYEEIMRRAKELQINELIGDRQMNTLLAIARYSIKLEEKFKHVNGRDVAHSNIKKICENKLLIDILKIYNHSNVPVQSRIVNWMVKRKMVNMLMLTMKIKNILNI